MISKNNSNIDYDSINSSLPTQALSSCHVLVTGATGFLGGVLIPILLSRGYQIRILIRTKCPDYLEELEVEIFQGDALNLKDLVKAMEGIHSAYYLMHSLQLGDKKFLETDRQIASNFRKASELNNLQRIIYLGGLGDPSIRLSDHLRGRLAVAEELQKGNVPVTFLRAAVIIGSGSTSFRIINHLVKNCPIIVFPKKADSKCQPIAVEDVIKYLVGCLENPETSGRSFDIGGEEILTYIQILKVQAAILNKSRLFFYSSFASINIYARIANFLTPVSFELIRTLMESCYNDVICQNNEIRKLIPFATIPYATAVQRALRNDINKGINSEEIKDSTIIQVDQTQSSISPPIMSKSILSDIKFFLLHKPQTPTLIKTKSDSERENFAYRILQRLDIGVTEYQILNIHKVGVNVPAKYIFEELLRWNGDSTCWPNHLAKVVRENEKLEHLDIYLFGWTKFPSWIKYLLNRLKLLPLFRLNSIHFQRVPDSLSPDNSRYLLYESSGGYPIGVFCMYVRSSIPKLDEKEKSQLFLMVGFNFYGKAKWSSIKFINRIWESIHDRVTANVLLRIKQLCEWRFEKIQHGGR